MLALWRLVARIIGPLMAARLVARRRREGVAADRLDEFRGIASRARPAGALVWFHAASVGESLSLLPLITEMRARQPGLICLVTTITATSARLMDERLPQGAFHQFAPLDAPRYLRRFRAHWQPGLLVVVENDLWPVMLTEADRANIPRARINARMSSHALHRWRRMPRTARSLMAPFRLTSVQDMQSRDALSSLGVDNLLLTGDMKSAASPPPADTGELDRLREQIGSRPVWAAISTHEGEEEIALSAHEELRAQLPDALLVLCPRHPERGDKIASLAPMTRRSHGQGPDSPVWLADTLGETGLWYRLAPVCFIGGSLVPVGGHNPWEGAQIGTALLHGPDTGNAIHAWAALDATGAAQEVSGMTLGAAVTALLSDPVRAQEMAAAGQQVAQAQADAVETIMQAFLALLPPQG